MRKKRFYVFLIVFLALFMLGIEAYADIPKILSYSGRLTDSAGRPVTSTRVLKFKIYSALTSGSVIWNSGNYSASPDANGVFSVLLGTQSDPVTDAVFNDTPRYLEIILDGTTMSPRARLVSSPYAYRALIADNVSNEAITRAKVAKGNFVKQIIAGNNVTITSDEGSGTGVVTIEVKSSAIPWTTSVNDIYNNKSGNVGIGMTNPTAKLDVNGSTGYNQVRIRTSYTPTASGDTNGNTGDISWDNGYIYVKTSAGWKRAALAAF